MKTSIALGALMAFAITGSAVAQTQPANPGPVIPGVCTYNNERAVATSTVGQSIRTRLEQIIAEVDAELRPQAQAIESEAETLSAQRSALTAEQYQAQAQALQQRAVAFDQLRQIRSAEVQRTEQVQLSRLAQAIDPILVQVYQERGCGLMLDRAAMYGANPAMDVTDRVIELLNSQLPSLTFNREVMPQEQAQ